ncbi:CRISP/Allergen/PR-1 isoform X1 [Cherax quadricarinatus]
MATSGPLLLILFLLVLLVIQGRSVEGFLRALVSKSVFLKPSGSSVTFWIPFPVRRKPPPTTTSKPPVTPICHVNTTRYNNFQAESHIKPNETKAYRSSEEISSANSLICHPENLDSFQPTEENSFQPTAQLSSQPTENNFQPTAQILQQPIARVSFKPNENIPFQTTVQDSLQLAQPTTTDRRKSLVCDYSKFHPRHSMVLGANAACSITRTGVSLEEKEEILWLHNTFRAKVASGREHRGDPGPQPQAANMYILHWNDELAVVAQAWANQCLFAHNGFEERRICSRNYMVGQNIYYHIGVDPSQNWAEAVHQWYEEVTDMPRSYAESFHIVDSQRNIYHYTQMMWGHTREVGCGAVYFSEYERIVSRVYVCHYGPSSNTSGAPLYQVGPPATACGISSPSIIYSDLCMWGAVVI